MGTTILVPATAVGPQGDSKSLFFGRFLVPTMWLIQYMPTHTHTHTYKIKIKKNQQLVLIQLHAGFSENQTNIVPDTVQKII